MTHPNILIQLDTDPLPSVFDAVVAVDSGAHTMLSYGAVHAENVTPLVHGAIFTRGGDALRHTAIFIGGSDVRAAAAVLAAVRKTFFGPMRVSVMFDANGCNTTASAAVLSAMRHVNLAESTATVLGGTGPVGLRVAHLLGRAGCAVRLGSRDPRRAREAIDTISGEWDRSLLRPVATTDQATLAAALEGAQLVFACGAAGVQLLDRAALAASGSVRVAIDLNAVPPMGIEEIEVVDRGREADGRILYGAVGVGALKMKIHRAAVGTLFTGNTYFLDVEEIFAIGRQVIGETV